MGRLFVVNLEGKIYSCKHCRTHLALCEDIVSKSFHCRHGRAYLFGKVAGEMNDKLGHFSVSQLVFLKRSMYCHLLLFDRVNVTVGETEERLMMTGSHTVADIFCVGCGSIVGWKYETAHEKSQKYKEGKSVLERFKISGPDGSNYWASHESHIGSSDADDA
ncbi:hypothetical protein JRO89_XS14G0108400 [Xanthoceras sorbifolium]|uniref:Protein yippee-like n=1 Tax=Xanthoceras sorbifolium TaxID=99658 RepID=A0ABQ8H4Y2_9ROSI|nr:hypothetical protein JRO89_XS14G0108400 [Xanthoceras sorbifolium]